MLYPRGVPAVRGGAERLWEGIVDEITSQTDHQAELIPVDSPEASFGDVVQSYARFDALDLSDFDLVITGKYPAWMVRHPRQVVYMAHPLRGLYDTYVGPTDVLRSSLSPSARELIDIVTSISPGRPGGRDQVFAAALAMLDELPADHPDRAFPGPVIRRAVRWLDHDALSRRERSPVLRFRRQ